MLKKIRSIGEDYLRDSVYAANDGIVTTFAVVAAVAGAALESNIIIVLGFANLLADAFSMATGNYMGTRSEGDQYDHEKQKARTVLQKKPDRIKEYVVERLQSLGHTGKDATTIATTMMKHKESFLDFFLYHKLGTGESGVSDALKNGAVTFVAFIIAGAVPLIPYVVLSGNDQDQNFLIACICTGLTMFFVGAIRTIFSAKSWVWGGLEMLIAGGIAATIAFGIGWGIKEVFDIAFHSHIPIQ